MTMPWFKTYPEARTDLKLRSLTRTQRSVWFDMLCYAAEQSDRGVIRFEDERLLALEVADGDVALLNETIEQLKAVRVISVDATDATHTTDETRCTVACRCITFLNFTKRQGSRVACNAKSSTERSRKSRNERRLRANATACNEMQRDATPATTDRDREEDKDNTPLTPLRGEAWVSTNGSEPEPAPKAFPPKSAKPPFDDAELTRVGHRAEKLFPMADFGGKIRGIAGNGPSEYPLAWIDSALTEMHASDKRDWRYLMGILKRYAADGGPKTTPQSRPRLHAPEPPPPGGQYHRSPQTLARLAKLGRAEVRVEAAAS